MKIKVKFESEKINNEIVMVSLDSNVFNGLLRVNETAAFIINTLKDDTSKKSIVEKFEKEFDVSAEVAVSSVDKILSQLYEAELIEE